MAGPLVESRLYDLDATLAAAHKLADRIMFEVESDGTHTVAAWKGLSCKTGTASSPAEALVKAYANLTAYLADGAR